jgi:hypothetical protein
MSTLSVPHALRTATLELIQPASSMTYVLLSTHHTMSLTTSTLMVGFDAAMVAKERALKRVAGTAFKCETAFSIVKCWRAQLIIAYESYR